MALGLQSPPKLLFAAFYINIKNSRENPRTNSKLTLKKNPKPPKTPT